MRNYFGKEKWESAITSETALNAGVARNLSIAQADLDNYQPFIYFYFENNSDETIELSLDGCALGDNSIVGARKVIYCPPKSRRGIQPYEDGRPDMIFSRVAIKNISATNTSNDELKWSIKNW